VFLPNPVAELQNESLTDQKDADYALCSRVPQRPLTDLDGSGTLTGDWAQVVSETGFPARSSRTRSRTTGTTTASSRSWRTTGDRGAELHPEPRVRHGHVPAREHEVAAVRINQYGQDNSFATDHPIDELRFGKGGVDDARTRGDPPRVRPRDPLLAELLVRERGGRRDQRGLRRLLGADVSNIIAPTPDPACVADWDSVSYTSTVPHCLRRVDTNLHYPTELSGEVHHDGQIWSRALWDIRGALGHVKADTIILNGQFDFPGTTMTALAQSTVTAAQSLYGKNAAKAVTTAFEDRGIL
jgi:hypothetical protein